ncbi:MAG: hypothetical protein OXH19_02670 [Chloroflexi bacterium]|nr:hypothetical protein [Chloroflexota bacterium]MCY3588042.1 hypothetical protein [Chloroflexota bacterium]MCY3684658.1 hypothetical protein [Chloroflexota bacterium]MDE2708093.1 hypothetical protein [Chloroflexota bacterium]
MSFPNYPDPAQRALMLQAYVLRQQGLTYRQIGERMDRAVSTVHGYLRDYELFRSDLIAELAADQIVSHLVQLADLDDPHHDRRLADIRELRLLLSSLPAFRSGEIERTGDILQPGVAIDRYGNRFLKPDRAHPPTPEELAEVERAEQAQSAAHLDPDQPLAYCPEPARTQPNAPEQEAPAISRLDAPRPDAGPSPRNEPDRTQPNGTEHQHGPNPVLNGRSSKQDRNSSPSEPLDDLISETLELFPHLKGQSDRQILNALEQFTEPVMARPR